MATSTYSLNVYKLDFLEDLAKKILEITGCFSNKTELLKLASMLSLNVFNAGFDDDNIAGMLKIENNQYNIYINKSQPIVRQRFTLAHEISHFILHKDLIDEQKGSVLYRKDFNSSSSIEQQANFLAAALLMPKEEIEKAWKTLSNILEIAEIFETSKEATYIRLNKLGLLNGQ